MAPLNANEARWVSYIAERIVPKLPGSASDRARAAALVTWWSLKEGVLDLPNPLRHNLCTGGAGDTRIGDLDVCTGPAWQVGISGIQPSAVSLSQAEATSRLIYPSDSVPDVLYRTAREAGVSDDVARAISQGPGDLRKSWLLRNGPIAFTLQAPLVRRGCVQGNASWCFGSWETARKFARDRATIQDTIGTLESRFLQGGIMLPLLVATAVGVAVWDFGRRGSVLKSVARKLA